jgi:hypothetical protein
MVNHPIRQPQEILAYRSLQRILASKSSEVWSISPSDSIFTALQIMAEKDIGFRR